MYLSRRTAQVRNLSLAMVNGSITLVILLIAPLGLAAVIVNTILVTLATLVTATVGDGVIHYLRSEGQRSELSGNRRRELGRRRQQELD
jgi:hypothetical protein